MTSGNISKKEMEYLNKKYEGENIDKLFSTGLLSHPADSSGPRQHMFSIHYAQRIMLDNPDTPRYFTGYEKTFGKYLNSYYKSAKNWEIIAKIVRHTSMPNMVYMLVVKEVGRDNFDVIPVSHYENLSDMHGYLRPFTEMDNRGAGSIIGVDDYVYKASSLDTFGNYAYGKNLKTAFIFRPEVKEDSVMISESCARNTTFHLVTKTETPIGKGDLMVNIRGDYDHYKGMMAVGETIPPDGILFALRKIERKNISADCTTSALSKMYYSDNKFQGRGMVVDIDIKVNDVEELQADMHRSQLYEIYLDQYRYNHELYEVLSNIVRNHPGQYSPRLEQELYNATNYINPNIKFSSNTGNFEFAYLTVYTAYQTPLISAIKVTNRCGAKAVIGKVAPDEQMPVNSDGVRADIVCSSAGIIGRGNVDQLKEQMTNYASDCIARRALKEKDTGKREALIVEYLKIMSPEWGNYVADALTTMSPENRVNYVLNMCKQGIYMYNPPMYKSISFSKLKEVAIKYKLKVSKVKMCMDYTVPKEIMEMYESEENINAIKQMLADFTPSGKKVCEGKGKDKIEKFIEDVATLQDILTPKKNAIGLSKADYKANPEIDDYVWNENAVGIQDLIDKNNDSCDLADYIDWVSTYECAFDKEQLNDKNADSFDTTKSRVFKKNDHTLTREFVSKYPIIISDIYFMVLRQIPSAAFSARSLGSMSPLGLPNKTMRKCEVGRPYGDTPNQLGEMETADLMKLANPDKVARYLATHSTNPDMRSELASMLMFQDPRKYSDLPYKDSEIANTIPVRMSNAYLSSIGLEIIPNGEEDPYEFFDDVDLSKTTVPKLMVKAGILPKPIDDEPSN